MTDQHGVTTARRRPRPVVVWGAGLGTVLALTALAVTGWPAPRVSWDADGDYTTGGVTFRQQAQGDALLHAAIGDPGQSEVRFTVTVPDQGLRLSPVCHGASVDHQVVVSLGGTLVSGQSCRVRKDPDPGSHGTRFVDEPARYLRELGLQPGDTVRARAWLSRTDDPAQSPVRQPDVVVGLGLYEDRRD